MKIEIIVNSMEFMNNLKSIETDDDLDSFLNSTDLSFDLLDSILSSSNSENIPKSLFNLLLNSENAVIRMVSSQRLLKFCNMLSDVTRSAQDETKKIFLLQLLIKANDINAIPNPSFCVNAIQEPLIRSLQSDNIALYEEIENVIIILATSFPISIQNLQFDYNALDSEKATRYISLYAKLLGINEVLFDNCRRFKLIEPIMNLIHSDDILSKLVCYENMLPEFGKTANGTRYLVESGILQGILQIVNEYGSPTYDALLGEQALRTLCRIITSACKTIDFTAILGDNLNESVLLRDLLIAIKNMLHAETASDKVAGWSALCDLACLSPHIVKRISDDALLLEVMLALMDSTPQVQGVFLNGVAMIFEKHTAIEYDMVTDQAFAQKVLKDFFIKIGTIKGSVSTLAFLYEQLRKPVSETRHGSYRLMTTFVNFNPTFAIVSLFQLPGFYDYLIERSTEFSKEGKEWKYGLIAAIYGKATSAGIGLGDKIFASLKKIIDQGPFFIEFQMEDAQIAT